MGTPHTAERHVSSVTLFNSPARAVDQDVGAIALHKASADYHPDKGGVLVKDASEHLAIEFGWAGGRMKLSGIAPPQLSPHAVGRLSYHHIQALFTLVTTEDPRIAEKISLLPIEHFGLFSYYSHWDWGNPRLVELSKRAAGWACRAHVAAAGGYYKAILRRSDNGSDGWFWALEWNCFLRLVGWIYYPSQQPQLFSDLPKREGLSLPGEHGRLGREIPLSEADDNLFAVLP